MINNNNLQTLARRYLDLWERNLIGISNLQMKDILKSEDNNDPAKALRMLADHVAGLAREANDDKIK